LKADKTEKSSTALSDFFCNFLSPSASSGGWSQTLDEESIVNTCPHSPTSKKQQIHY
jgi:hypothetical protein